MSIVTVQIGQCGNQLGYNFFQTLTEEIFNKTSKNHSHFNKFLKESGQKDEVPEARAILLDTESKVVTRQLGRPGTRWRYAARHSSVQQQGAANNWACGYHHNQSHWADTVRDLARKEAEQCDWLEGFFPFMSLAGGTGSGLGSLATETLRDDFPRTPILSHVVCPFHHGEVSVQSYNVVLSAASLTGSADGLVLLENDQLQQVCTQHLGLRCATLQDLNSLAAQQLAALHLPACLLPTQFTATLGDLLAHCTPHPQFKLLGPRLVPQEPPTSRAFSTPAWKTLVRNLRRTLLYGATVEEGDSGSVANSRYVSVLAVLRGSNTGEADLSSLQNLDMVSWGPGLQTWTAPGPTLEMEKCALVAANGPTMLPPLRMALEKAWNLFGVRAFLHQYTRYGMDQEAFVESFARVEQILASYSNLCK